MTNLDRNSLTWSSLRLGRWAMSIAVPSRAARHMTVATFADGRRPARRAAVGGAAAPPLAGLGAGDHERRHLVRLRPHLDDVVLAHPVGGDVDLAPVDEDVAVPDKLAGHVAALGEARPVDHVVETALQDLEQHLAGLAALAGRLLVVVVELPLKDAVHAAGLLLLPDLEQVLALLRPVPAVLAGRVGADLNGALRRIALGALQEQFHLLPAAALAVRTGVSSHLSLLLDPAPLGRAAAIVRNRRDVLDRADLQPGGLQRPDGGFPPRARALDEDVDLAHAMLHGAPGGGLGRHLGGERRRLTRALEADLAG